MKELTMDGTSHKAQKSATLNKNIDRRNFWHLKAEHKKDPCEKYDRNGIANALVNIRV